METKDWNAWIDLMPPKPNHFHVTGMVYVGNPGIEATLKPRVPQGINPTILLLDLFLEQKPGGWNQVMTWVEARYDLELGSESTRYTQVEIFLDDTSIAEIDVKEVH